MQVCLRIVWCLTLKKFTKGMEYNHSYSSRMEHQLILQRQHNISYRSLMSQHWSGPQTPQIWISLRICGQLFSKGLIKGIFLTLKHTRVHCRKNGRPRPWRRSEGCMLLLARGLVMSLQQMGSLLLIEIWWKLGFFCRF